MANLTDRDKNHFIGKMVAATNENKHDIAAAV